MVGFTIRQIERDRLSRKICSNVGIPTAKNFKQIVSTTMISRCTIPVANIINAEKIYGASIGSLKFKLTRRKTRQVIKDDIKTPSDIYKKNQTLSYALKLSI